MSPVGNRRGSPARVPRRAAPGRRWAPLWTALLLAGCSGGSGLGPDADFVRRSEVVVEVAPEGLEQAVVVDSVSWDPAALLATGDDEILEVEGPYRVAFYNTGERTLEVRYDLRFFDDGGVLVDRFIPFGLPVVLEPGARRTEAGRFVIRSTPRVGRFGLRLLRVAVRLALPDSGRARGLAGRPP